MDEIRNMQCAGEGIAVFQGEIVKPHRTICNRTVGIEADFCVFLNISEGEHEDEEGNRFHLAFVNEAK